MPTALKLYTPFESLRFRDEVGEEIEGRARKLETRNG
ncbi:hypothetical protein Arcpr_0972 [Archaeoglobus profundus DSM 5631]|uniref:Uncharacterized protein n=1 Tax=Archaeoglobus profundus (strain DSM 5631 / JCM 9629 / NBRC 100127 / Av18) TaxID=572546 RepID=D2RIA8_ARCPA|nr:hypothetical protein Arcpr_0972 [Archaeoglobus profundus DSM 5631]